MKSSGELTPRQKEVFVALCRWIQENGYPPTMRELGRITGLSSTRSIFDHLGNLEKLGYIRRHRDQSRAIEILRELELSDSSVLPPGEKSDDGVLVPLIGEVAAGSPILAQENREGEMRLDPSIARDPSSYLLRVRGESMIEAHICDGDLILIRPQQEASNGEIVVVLIEDEVTLKRFYRRDGFVELVPENSSMASIFLTPEMGDSRVLGKLMAVIRRC